MHQNLSFFIAGTIQGSRLGTAGMDQSYRPALQKTILAKYPNSIIHCPQRILMERFAGRLEQALAVYEEATAREIIQSNNYSSVVMEIKAAYLDLIELASQSDVVVAYLPGHEASMGTAMEIWSAYASGKIIITISPMTQNLALVSTSTVILPSIEQFDRFLASGDLQNLVEKRRS